jgi:NodT family efflux transporter outer membrane factor (OMF) lipoprotein
MSCRLIALLGLAAGLAATLAGCLAVGPDYRRPELDAPAAWTRQQDESRPAGALEEVAWWEAFGDPILDELIARGVAGNLDIAQARARVLQARADVKTAKAALFPSLDFSASSTSSSNGPLDAGTGAVTTSTPSTTSGTSATTTATSGDASSASNNTVFATGFDASWELDFFGGNRRSHEAAQASLEASVEDLRSTRLTLLGDVATYYIALRASQEQLGIAQQSAQAQRQNAEVTRERFRLGLITQLDLAQAEGQAASTAADIPSLESAIKQSIHRLGILLGLPPEALAGMLAAPRSLPDLSGPLLATGLPSELLTRRPDVRKAERKLAAASANIGVATAGLYPKFDLTAGLGLQGASPAKIAGFSTWYWSVLPGLSWPVFDAGSARAAVDKKKALYDEALASYQATFHTALEDVENALAAYYAELERGKNLAASVRAYEDAVALANERYVKGLTTFLTVLVNQAYLYSAQTNLAKSRANLRTDIIALYKALGGGWKAMETDNIPG